MGYFAHIEKNASPMTSIHWKTRKVILILTFEAQQVCVQLQMPPMYAIQWITFQLNAFPQCSRFASVLEGITIGEYYILSAWNWQKLPRATYRKSLWPKIGKMNEIQFMWRLTLIHFLTVPIPSELFARIYAYLFCHTQHSQWPSARIGCVWWVPQHTWSVKFPHVLASSVIHQFFYVYAPYRREKWCCWWSSVFNDVSHFGFLRISEKCICDPPYHGSR